MTGNRVAVLGLDGVPFGLLKELFRQGLMPNLAEFAGNGTFLPMETTIPPVSSVAWASFMTGANPGAHGIYGFTDLHEGQRALRLPSFDDIRLPTLWYRLSHVRALVVNLPFTYPARPLNGTLIAGFVAPVLERAVYPESLLPWLGAKGYRVDVDAASGRMNRRLLVADLFDTLNIREEVMLTLAANRPWDLFIGVITGTDRLHHFFFDAADDPENPFHVDFINYYRRLDVFFARLRESLGAATGLIVLSDHGFTRLQAQVYLNQVLKKMGCLNFTRPDPSDPEHVHPDSLAFAMDPTRIYLNSTDRFRDGVIGDNEKELVRMRLKSELEGLTLHDLGLEGFNSTHEADGPLFERVFVKEELYDGECVHLAPDLVVLPKPGLDIKAAMSVPTITMKDIFTGMHTHGDAFLMADDPDVASLLPNPRITDVANLILSKLTSGEYSP